MPNAVLDSTILVSAFLTKMGVSAELLYQAVGGAFQLSLAEEIIGETQRVLLEYQRIRKRYRYSDREVRAFCQALRKVFPLITELPHLESVSRDPHDDPVIACAIKAGAQYLVTRDKDLLSMRKYKTVKMTSPEEFMALLR